MTIDNNPTLDEDNRTIKAKSNINTDEETTLVVNGVLTYFNDDYSDITDDTITLKDDTDFVLDWDNDVVQIMYTEA